MKFNCLSNSCPLFGPHLLEASAGTGKTFAIEHVFVRLILKGIPYEEILAVTFTRAIARELKDRIRTNIEHALTSIDNGEPMFPYLEEYIGSLYSKTSLTLALNVLDQAQIFTIHGFCFRMLNEFAMETGRFKPTQDSDHPFQISKKFKRELDAFFKSEIKSVCQTQISLLFSKYDTVREIRETVLKSKEPLTKPLFYEELEKEFLDKISNWELNDLEEEFEAISPNYKAKKGDFAAQVNLLKEKNFKKLISHSGTIFSFLSDDNKKVRPKSEAFSPFFKWAETEIAPLVMHASNKKKIMEALVYEWNQFRENKESPDEILNEMNEAIKIPDFKRKIEKKYQAVIIDEFQDTDPLQWEIFYRAFIEKNSLKALYLVGDPKQSIYRFRNADVYTYFKAKKILGQENTYLLDTNYRSSKELIGTLNALFSRNFLKLPKTGETIPYEPVFAGSSIQSDLGDGKKAVHFLLGNPSFAYAAKEIETLNVSYGSIAILVKDRFEALDALQTLKSRGIPCVARSHTPLGKTKDFKVLREFLDAVLSPLDENLRSIASRGPFSRDFSFKLLNDELKEKGLAHLFKTIFKGVVLSRDLKAILEEFFAWEKRGFSISGFKSFLSDFERDEGVFQKMDASTDSVQILTLHVSKGLEFDVVFAYALGSGSPEHEEEKEEFNAEKLRQLYVAMTRAKKRLYLPFNNKHYRKRVSPMDLFLEGDDFSLIERLAKEHSISYEEVEELSLDPISFEDQKIKKETDSISYTPSFIQSFTSLKKGNEVHFIDSSTEVLPRGKETGTIIHNVFESIFLSQGLWKEEEKLDSFIEKKVMGTHLEEVTPFVQAMIQATLSQPLFDGNELFSLKELNRGEVFPEMEFFYKNEANFVSGSIDLVFYREKKLYFIDWKTNVLRTPTPQGVQEVMSAYNYPLQAALYKEALSRHFEAPIDPFFGGAFYLFVRTGSVYHFIPESL